MNLDFHNIPYWGEEEPLVKEYVPTRGKGMRAVKSIAVQDQASTLPFWGTTLRADLSADRAVLVVADVCDEFLGEGRRKLVFDCTSVTHRALSKLNERGVLFATLRRSSKKLREGIASVPEGEWRPVKLSNPKRKHQRLEYHESMEELRGYRGEVRQVVVRGNGHEEPMVLITNDLEVSVRQTLEDYARRWRLENNLSENTTSSPRTGCPATWG